MADNVDVEALAAWIRGFARLVADNKDMLTHLDSAIGDADHGINMDRGMSAVAAALDEGPADSAAALLKLVGMKLVSALGERSVGHQDPGATSVTMLVAAAASALSGEE